MFNLLFNNDFNVPYRVVTPPIRGALNDNFYVINAAKGEVIEKIHLL